MTDRITMGALGHAGRFGNQLWQLAATVGLAHTHGLELALRPDWEYRRFYSVPDEWFSEDWQSARDATDFATHLDKRARVYLQDLSLFAHVAPEIREAFRLRPECQEVVEREWDGLPDLPRPICAVHVRRGDTLQNPPGTIQPLSAVWYRKALGRARPYGSVLVFTDDPTWCERNIDVNVPCHVYRGVPRSVDRDPAYKVEPVLDWIDLHMMAKAAAHVISNSSYGWWGAFLADSSKVIYPRKWFGPKIAAFTDYTLMIAPGWRGCM